MILSQPYAIALFGMSGVGKTHIAKMLASQGNWFHYSVDYRIGSHYLAPAIESLYQHEAVKNTFFDSLFRADAVRIVPRIRFDNLAALSHFLGKPGNIDKGGIGFTEYCRRQELHRQAEISALKDISHFISCAQRQNFIADTGGSMCEVVNPDDPNDALLNELTRHVRLVYLRAMPTHQQTLIERFNHAPKPIYYRPDFLQKLWYSYLQTNNCHEDQVDPDDFIRFGFSKLLDHRLPIYEKIAQKWGCTVDISDISDIKDPVDLADFLTDAAFKNAH